MSLSTAMNPSFETYIMNSASSKEEDLSRLLNLDAVVTQLLGGPFPDYPDLSQVRTVLDLGCGPGGWAFTVSTLHPNMSIIGVDKNQSLVEYARMRAQTLGLAQERVRFDTLDVTQFPWPFEDNTFDLINGRFLQSFLRVSDWPLLLHECLRVLKPGKQVRLTEAESTITNARHYEQLHSLLPSTLQHIGHSFALDGRNNGITHMLDTLLSNAKFSAIEHTPHFINYSVGQPAHGPFVDLIVRTFAPSLLGTAVVKEQLTDSASYLHLYQRALSEFDGEDFCAGAYFLTVTGKKAEHLTRPR